MSPPLVSGASPIRTSIRILDGIAGALAMHAFILLPFFSRQQKVSVLNVSYILTFYFFFTFFYRFE